MSIAYDNTLEAHHDAVVLRKQLLIDGQHVESVSGKTFNTLNPATGEVIATVAEGGVLRMIASDTTFKITSHGKPTANILFPHGALFENQPVIPTLAHLGQFAAKAIQSLEAFCFGNAPDPNPVPS